MSFGSMDASARLLLLSIPTLVVALYLHRRQSQFRGIGMFGASCPRCAAPLPSVRKTTSIRKYCGADGLAANAAARPTGTVGREIGNHSRNEPAAPSVPRALGTVTAIGSAPDRTCRRTAICKRVRSPPHPALTLRLTFLPPVSSRLID
jgi:hypothetical protein